MLIQRGWIRAGWKVQLAASDFRSRCCWAIGQHLDRASTDSSTDSSTVLCLSLSFSKVAKVHGN